MLSSTYSMLCFQIWMLFLSLVLREKQEHLLSPRCPLIPQVHQQLTSGAEERGLCVVSEQENLCVLLD